MTPDEKDRLNKVEELHSKLYNRVRDNETKYMPAVTAAHEAKAEVVIIKAEMRERLSHLSQFDSIQDIKIDAFHKRMDVADRLREKQAEATDSIHNDLTILATRSATSSSILMWIASFLVIYSVGFGIWIVNRTTEHDVRLGKLELLIKSKGGNSDLDK